ncbi:MAG TPA: tRNA (adenosine(37)-N6)-threonylcarbamoyltransferase complex dimerization subunit type 1 TsaB [Pyrinomonadaceae bacterium]
MDNAPLILSVETATLAGSVSLTRGNKVLLTLSGDNEVSHSNRLLSEIHDVLSQTGYSLRDLDFFAVATGPGSFTGLRIGIATVKGLAYTLKRPCIGVPTLHAVAHSAKSCERVVAVLPAGRGEVFVQMFQVSSEEIIPLDTATHIDPLSMLEKYSQFADLCWCGEGAHLHREKIQAWAERNGRQLLQSNPDTEGWRLVPKTIMLAEQVGVLAFRMARDQQFQSPETLRAIYVRPSDAELKTKSAE